MEAALRNLLSVSRLTPSSCLFFFQKNQCLQALFVTPKAWFELHPAAPLPQLSLPPNGFKAFLKTCKVRVSIERREFELCGLLKGGGGFCSKGTIVEELPQKKNSRLLDALWKISEALPGTQLPKELSILDDALKEQNFDTFLEVIDTMARISWLNSTAKEAVTNSLLSAAEDMYLLSQTSGLDLPTTQAQIIQISISQMRHCIIFDEVDELYQECCFDLIESAIQEVATSIRAPEMRIIAEAMTGSAPHDLSPDSAVFRESLIATKMLLKVVSAHPRMLPLLDEMIKKLEEWPWQAQVMMVHCLMRLEVPGTTREEVENHFETRLFPLLHLREGQNSWKVRFVAAQCIGFFLQTDASDAAKEVVSRLVLTALESETNKDVLSLLKNLPRTYLDRSLMCVALAGTGMAGLYCVHTQELKMIQHSLFHGTARIVVSLRGTLILTGGVLHPKNTYEIMPDTLVVKELGSLQFGRFWHAALLVGHEVMVTGGKPTPNGKALNTCEKLSGDKWMRVANMMRCRESHSCTAWGDSKVYAVAGLGDDGASQSIEAMSNGEWKRLSIILPSGLLIPAVVLKSECELIIAGGKSDRLLSEVMIVNLSSGTRQRLPLLAHSSAFAGNAAEFIDDKLILLSSESAKLLSLTIDSKHWKVQLY